MTRNPGLLSVTVGVGLAVLFALMGATKTLPGQIGFGLAIISLVVAALIYVFYSRSNVVEKTGYGALLFIIATAFIIPLLIVDQQQAQVTRTADNYKLTLQRGAALFGQYCATCHGFQGKGKAGPALNDNPDVNKLTNDDLTRIISAGVPKPNALTKYLMPSWSQTFGGPLTADDISYLVALIRSSDPAYTEVNAPSGYQKVNGFDYVLSTLTNPTQIAQYEEDKKGGSKPAAGTFTDLTGQSTVTITALDSTNNVSGFDWFIQDNQNNNKPANITIRVGTKVTWGNKTAQ